MATWGDLNIVNQRGTLDPNDPLAIRGRQLYDQANQGGIFNRMTTPPPPVNRANVPLKTTTPVTPPPARPQGNLWEIIQNEKRRGAFQDEYMTVDPFRNYSDQISHLDGNNLTPDQQKYLDKYGIKMGYTPGYTSGPMGEGATVENVPGQWHQTSGSNTYDPSKNPKTVFGHDFRLVTERDKGLIPREDAIVWDDNYGWITHKKNYNQNGNETWFMKNAKTIMPALFTMGMGALGAPALALSTANLGRAGLDVAMGNSSWQSLLPALLSMGMGASGLNSFLTSNLGRFGGALASGAIRGGTGMALNNLTRGGRRG